ncbi:MAG: hypothetical protein CL388_08885 [Acidiferrobacteraceae bacterium]|nr:hypothetical protein [Acidiferrobacteraceae bacterium]
MTLIHYSPFKCWQCDTEGVYPTVLSRSGSGFDRQFWTDGEVTELLTPRSHPAVICPKCREVHWIEDLEASAQQGLIGSNQSPDPVYPEARDYFRYASSSETNTAREVHVRILGWRYSNDPRREDIENRNLTLGDPALDNLRALEALLPLQSDYDHMLMAEVKRELSDFDGALEVADQFFDTNPDRSGPVFLGLGFITILAERADFNVMRIPEERTPRPHS